MFKGFLIVAVLGLFIGMAASVEAAAPLSPEELVQAKKAELMGTGYQVKYELVEGSGKLATDVVSFENNKVTFEELAALGYGPSNFTVHVEVDGTVTFDSMQVADDGSKAFLHGELYDGLMSGRLTLEDKKEIITKYSFKSL